jgi:hypothetical protein
MNYALTIITALLLTTHFTTPLHAAARMYQPLRQAYLRSTQTLSAVSPAARGTLSTTLGRYQPFLTGQKCRMSTSAGTTSSIDISPYLTSLEGLEIHPAVEGYQYARLTEPGFESRWVWRGDIAGWNKLAEDAWQKSPAEYLKSFSYDTSLQPNKLWQAVILKDLSTRITPENALLLLDALLKEPNIKDIDTNIKSIVYTLAQQDKDAAAEIISSANYTSLHGLLWNGNRTTNKAGGKLIANIMTPEIATQMIEQIKQDPSFIKYGWSTFLDVASKIIQVDPTTSNDLVQSIGKTFDNPFPFSTATAALIIKEHPETIKTLYPYIKSNLPQLLWLADNWNPILIYNQDIKEALGEENRAIELINSMLQNVPEAQHDFYSFITNYRDRIQSKSSAVKDLIANIQKNERPRLAKDAFKTGLGLATAAGIGYGLYKACGDDEQADSRVQE